MLKLVQQCMLVLRFANLKKKTLGTKMSWDNYLINRNCWCREKSRDLSLKNFDYPRKLSFTHNLGQNCVNKFTKFSKLSFLWNILELIFRNFGRSSSIAFVLKGNCAKTWKVWKYFVQGCLKIFHLVSLLWKCTETHFFEKWKMSSF